MAIEAQPAARRAIIVGGSLGGLFAALLLRRSGWEVEVHERVAGGLSGRGAGIVTHPELFAVLARAGIARDEAEVGVAVSGRRVFGIDGALLAERALPQVLTAWGHLHGLLHQALPAIAYRSGRSLVRVEEAEDAVTAHFADGSTARGDLLVGADGIGSTVRTHHLPEVAPLYAGYVAWRGLVDEADLTDETRAALCDHFSFCLPPGEQMLGYPVAGEGRGGRRFNFVWYRPAAGPDLAGLLTDIDGLAQPLSIAPNRIRPEVIAGMRRDARRLLAPPFAEVVERTGQPFLQAIQDLETPRMALGRRTVILGDAAFVARPHVGMGVTKAAADADALARALDAHPHDLPAALSQFEAARLAVGRAVVLRARELGASMQAQILTPRERALAERHRSPEAVMAETAVAAGLAA
ncbi:FAD-dependent oxidoreductase [Methylobacterium currus]|uniref:FAD-dependent oxidoreductase n=2 Tax=Methylobacterium currus TaxID=2051553 RepID=A0A2R4WFG0_9HYPH|nr:FAD-dependent monooxygenase [Methylobacterium currus]AWB20277.1 FAD-dependent oxidoreductase [Methylobacterium currus]UHC19105.1 FAD-dependent monooxygenase [Methylobacterium currus]